MEKLSDDEVDLLNRVAGQVQGTVSSVWIRSRTPHDFTILVCRICSEELGRQVGKSIVEHARRHLKFGSFV